MQTTNSLRMKTRLTRKTFAALGLALVPFINGCTQQSASNTPAYITTSSVAPPVVHVAPAAPMPAEQPAPVVAEVPQQTEPVPASIVMTNEPVILPEKLRISQSLNEVIRLAQSGVDQGVILTYVTNSSAMFVLGAEEIVYLNDLGIDSNVITAMMQRDQSLKVSFAASAQQIAAAPTYVNPPQPVVQESQPAQPVQITENYFYDSLSPYGTWVEVEGYGRCWRPTVAVTSPSWRPYVDRGRWVHTDAGWYWMSDYSWGSVAFHYGRWFSHPRMGWCWWPDNVWGPSWVSWRYDNDNCGWAPLPPLSYYRHGSGFYYRDRHVGFSFDFGIGADSFTFVQWGRFWDPRPYQYCLPRNRVNTVYNQTTIINNYGDGNNNTVINRGISTDRVRQHSRAEIRTASIRDERPRKGEVRGERLEGGGRTLVVPRPILPPVPPLPGVGKIGNPFEKSNARVYSTTPAAPAVSPAQPAPGNPREDRRENRSGRERIMTAPASINQPVVVAPVTTPQPDNNRSGRNEREQRTESNPTERNRSTQVVAPTPTVTAPAPTPARTATPIFSKPLVVETVPHNPVRPVVVPPQNSTAVIGDGRNRTPGRDYSVRSTPQQPAPTPQPAPTASAPDFNRGVSRSESPARVQNEQSPQLSPSENRLLNNARREDRITRDTRANVAERQTPSRVEVRSQAPVIVTPAPAPRPAQTYTPPPAPAYTPPPAPVAPRVESRPAPTRIEPVRVEPARVEPSRAEPRSESRSNSRQESRSESNQTKRDR